MKEIITLINVRKKSQSTSNLLINDELLQECYSHLSAICNQQTSDFCHLDLHISKKKEDNVVMGIPSYRERKLLSMRHPLTSLLAIIRKQGMDLLLPAAVQDKILVTIFVAIKAETGPAHKELIDMVMTVKETIWQVELDQISKTKIRGVLTLLKHAESLSLQAAKEDTPVSLGIADDISCFEDLRVKHDKFLKITASKENVHITDWRDITWPDNLEERAKRIALCKKFEKELVIYFEKVIAEKVIADEKLKAELKLIGESMSSPYSDDLTTRENSRDDWGIDCKDSSRDSTSRNNSYDDWYESNWSTKENSPDNKRQLEAIHIVLPPTLPVVQTPMYTTGPIIMLPLPTMLLPLPCIPPPNQLIEETDRLQPSHQIPSNLRYEQRAGALANSLSNTPKPNPNPNPNPQYSLWTASSFVTPNTILHSGLRNNVDIIDLTLSIMNDDHGYGDSQSSHSFLRGGSPSPSKEGHFSEYDLSPFDLIQSFGKSID